MNIEAGFDNEDMKKIMLALGRYPEECTKATISAMNKSLSAVNTRLQREITSKYNIKKKDLTNGNFNGAGSKSLVKEHKATGYNMNAYIEVRGTSLTLGRFLKNPKSPVSHAGMTLQQIKKIKQPTVAVGKGKSKRLAISPKAFVATGRGGVVGVFQRDANNQMQMLRTLSTAQMASNEDVVKKTQQEAEKIVPKKVEQEINYRLSKLGR